MNVKKLVDDFIEGLFGESDILEGGPGSGRYPAGSGEHPDSDNSGGGELPKWKKLDDGSYQTDDGRFRVFRERGSRGGRGTFKLQIAGGKTIDLGARATFDHAENALAKEGMWPVRKSSSK